MAGTSMGRAPCSSRSCDRALAWARLRVTRTRFPKRGPLSYQRSFSLSLTTSPTMATTGGERPASRALSTMLDRSPSTVCCSGSEAHRTRATGVVGGKPLPIRLSTILGRFSKPMSTTRVPPLAAIWSQAMADSALEGSSLPLTTVKEEAILRWVRGMPA